MTSVALLENKVRKRSLPGVQGSPPGAAPLLKRLLLPQGELAQFYDADDGIRYIAFAELVPDRIRGNHYHVRKEEFVYIIQGKTLLVIEDVQSNRRESTSLETG